MTNDIEKNRHLSEGAVAMRENARHPNGTFGEHARTAPETELAALENKLWLVEGDDHEARVYEAASQDEAEQYARQGFASQYDCDEDDVYVQTIGLFTGDVDDDPSEWEFVPNVGDSRNEDDARRALEYAEIQ